MFNKRIRLQTYPPTHMKSEARKQLHRRATLKRRSMDGSIGEHEQDFLINFEELVGIYV